ncbi:hypothetical protein GS571_20170 [Rhodococcus hoagii]|nr:hypothetical protein [Prescottella equi]
MTEVVEQPADVGDDVVDAVVLEAIGNIGLPMPRRSGATTGSPRRPAHRSDDAN